MGHVDQCLDRTCPGLCRHRDQPVGKRALVEIEPRHVVVGETRKHNPFGLLARGLDHHRKAFALGPDHPVAGQAGRNRRRGAAKHEIE